MYVHEEKGLCFLAHPRAASRSVRDAIYQVGFEQKGDHHDGPDQGHDLSPYQTFCVVRNHWDTLVSWWYNGRMHRKEPRPSLRWLAIHLSRNRYFFRAGSLWWFFQEVPGIHVLRYETLNPDLNRFLQRHGLPPVTIPEVGISTERKKRHYSEYYDDETREFLRWCFLKEILQLNYRFDQKEECTSTISPAYAF